MNSRATSYSTLEQYLFLFLLFLVTALFLYLLTPFFAPVFWACVVSLLFYPAQVWMLRFMGVRPNLIAFTTLLLCIVVAVIPMMLILSSFVQEGAAIYAKIDSGEIDPELVIDRLQSELPFMKKMLNWLGMDIDSLKEQTTTGALAASSFVAKNVLTLGQRTFGFFLSLALMLYLTFFLMRDGHRLLDLFARALPLGAEREKLFFSKFTEVTRATVKGNLVVAIVQGLLGGIIFWVLDLPAPILWTVAMAVLSLIPAVGAGLIWLPFAIYLFATGEVGSSIILVIYGVTVIGLADNILRPILVGRDTKLPDWLVLLSTLSGLRLFGIQGFVLGPLIAALFIVFWQIFSRDYNNDELQTDEELSLPENQNPDLVDESAEVLNGTRAIS
jgi:predicted PurR-regulated permease PerM